jgi:hypothetical protein
MHSAVHSRRATLDSGRGEYYGISWNPSGTRFATSHSKVENNKLQTLTEYAGSEVGTVSISGREVLHFLSAPHQILWVDEDHLVATNTGRNMVVCVNVDTGFTLQRRVGTAPWDRLSAQTFEGVHLNSLFFKGGTLYVLAHNFGKGSFACRFSWPQLELKDKHLAPNLTELHNLYIDDDDRWVVCDSKWGALADARSGRCLWTNGGQSYTRGLAATKEFLFVGSSEKSGRELRTGTETGIWVVDRATFKTTDYIYLGHFGCVHDVRIGSEADLAHHGHPLQAGALTFLEDAAREHIKGKLDRSGLIQPIVGAIDYRGERIAAEDGAFLLGVLTSQGQNTTGISARFHFDPTNGSATAHAGLVARYHGPNDENMVAAIFQLDQKGNIEVGIWTHGGSEWRQHSSMSVAANMIELRGGLPTLKASLRWTAESIWVDLAGNAYLLTSLRESTFALQSGKCGFRMHGRNIELSELAAIDTNSTRATRRATIGS